MEEEEESERRNPSRRSFWSGARAGTWTGNRKGNWKGRKGNGQPATGGKGKGKFMVEWKGKGKGQPATGGKGGKGKVHDMSRYSQQDPRQPRKAGPHELSSDVAKWRAWHSHDLLDSRGLADFADRNRHLLDRGWPHADTLLAELPEDPREVACRGGRVACRELSTGAHGHSSRICASAIAERSERCKAAGFGIHGKARCPMRC